MRGSNQNKRVRAELVSFTGRLLETGWEAHWERLAALRNESWFRHLVRMPQGWLLREVFLARPIRRKPQEKSRTMRRDYISTLAGEYIGILH